MKVLIVLKRFPVLSETFILNQVHNLIQQGVDVQVYSHYRPNAIINNPLFDDIKERVVYYELQGSSLRKLGSFIVQVLKSHPKNWFRALINPVLYYKNRAILYDYNIEIVHCHFGAIAEEFYNNYTSNGYFKGAKLVNTFHGFDLAPAALDSYTSSYKNLFRHFHLLTYNSPYLGNLLSQTSNQVKTVEIPVGFNIDFLDRFKEAKIKDGRFNLLFCGRLIVLKGVMLLPLIVEQVRQVYPEVKLYIIGDGEMRSALEEQIKALNLTDYIEVLGALNQGDVFFYMNRASVLLMPGIADPITQRAETQGLVIQEAQYFGIPAIVSDAGGMKYGIQENETGFVVAQGDVAGFAACIMKLIADQALYQSFSQKAEAYVIDKYNISTLNKQLIKQYELLLKANHES